MKYSIRGALRTADGSSVVNVINSYELWRLTTSQGVVSPDDSNPVFYFEAWVNTVEDKDNLFNELKPFVDQYANNSAIDWHECTHDETLPQPCVITEEYRR